MVEKSFFTIIVIYIAYLFGLGLNFVKSNKQVKKIPNFLKKFYESALSLSLSLSLSHTHTHARARALVPAMSEKRKDRRYRCSASSPSSFA